MEGDGIYGNSPCSSGIGNGVVLGGKPARKQSLPTLSLKSKPAQGGIFGQPPATIPMAADEPQTIPDLAGLSFA